MMQTLMCPVGSEKKEINKKTLVFADRCRNIMLLATSGEPQNDPDPPRICSLDRI
jgi:hypothetical protein